MNKITGHDLKDWGYIPGRAFGTLLIHARKLDAKGISKEDIKKQLEDMFKDEDLFPKLMEKRDEPLVWTELIDVSTKEEEENLDSVRKSMSDALRVPVVMGGSVMPDACPAGVAPVGSIIASEMIHPGYHSADICCSVALTAYKVEDGYNPAKLIDAAKEATHFGIGRNESVPEFWRDCIESSFEKSNFFLEGLSSRAVNDLGTQGDGNHFLFLGKRKSDGLLCIVTHHGSRSLGAQVYRRAMRIATEETKKSARGMGNHSWLDPKSDLGDQYWKALEYVRDWTQMNHLCIHDMVADEWRKDLNVESRDFFWNEHNFIFKKEDGLYYHAKGATPNYSGFSKDDSGKTLVPLNMGEPILVLEHTNNGDALGFAPHGAGRNMSRTQYLKTTEEHPYPEGVEVRFYTGNPDLSELPNAYKSGDYIRDSISRYNIGNVVDEIEPLGSIMAGQVDWSFLKKRKKRNAG